LMRIKADESAMGAINRPLQTTELICYQALSHQYAHI